MNIIVDNVSFGYPDRLRGRIPALNGLSLSVSAGSCLGILGPEGSGKSTLIELLGGLLRPEAGSILVDGTDLWGRPETLREFRRRTGICFQFPEQQFICGTVAEELVYAANRFGIKDSLGPEVALGFFGLGFEALKERSPLLLSVGEARRVALASILGHRPSLVLLDEPTSGLDGPGTDSVVHAVQSLQRAGATVVVTSHDVDVLAEMSTRVAVMVEGRVKIEGDARMVLSNAGALEEHGFPLPGGVAALRELRAMGNDEAPPVRLEEIRAYLKSRGQARREGPPSPR
jgi:energy-coupling factor transporter ATP-binding protein EcfA2